MFCVPCSCKRQRFNWMISELQIFAENGKWLFQITKSPSSKHWWLEDLSKFQNTIKNGLHPWKQTAFLTWKWSLGKGETSNKSAICGFQPFVFQGVLLLMAEILHQLIGSLSHYL